MTKKVFSAILMVTLTGLICVAPLAAADKPFNEVFVNFATMDTYNFPGDAFIDQTVQANRVQTTQLVNPHAQPLNAKIELDTPNRYELLDGFLARNNLRVSPYLIGPPVYAWSFEAIPYTYSASATVGYAGNQVDTNFGFDVTRSVDRTHFTGSGTQTLTITVTPRTSLPDFRIYLTLLEDEHINPTIDSLKTDPAQGLNVSPDGYLLGKQVTNPTPGVPFTFQVEINVRLKPGTAQADFMPWVSVDTFVTNDSGLATDAASLSYTMSDTGTWTWGTAENHAWSWEVWQVKMLRFNTYSSGTEEGFAASVPLPAQVSTSPGVIGTNVLLVSVLVLLFYAAASIFNGTLKENYESITGWGKSIRARLRRRKTSAPVSPSRRGRHFPEIALILVITAVVNSLVDPGFGISLKGLIVFSAMAVTSVASIYGYDGIRVLVTRRRYHAGATIKAYPLAILLAIIFVGISRLINFYPGFIFGFVGAFTVLPYASSINEHQRSIGILWGVLTVMLISLAAFLLRQPLTGWPDGFWRSMADTALAALFVGGLEGLLFGLLPVTFLDGGVVAAWKKWVWLVLFIIIAFFFFSTVINQREILTGAVKNMKVVWLSILVAASFVFSLMFWLFFRIQTSRTKNRRTLLSD